MPEARNWVNKMDSRSWEEQGVDFVLGALKLNDIAFSLPHRHVYVREHSCVF